MNTLLLYLFWVYSVSFKTVVRESKFVTQEMTALCSETALPTILSSYELKNVFSADKFSLFCQCLSSILGEKSVLEKNVVRCNWIKCWQCIRKNIPDVCFRKVKKCKMLLKCQAFVMLVVCQLESCMSIALIEEWVRELQSRTKRKSRKVEKLSKIRQDQQILSSFFAHFLIVFSKNLFL